MKKVIAWAVCALPALTAAQVPAQAAPCRTDWTP